jgi:hypothetical protein
LKDIGRYDGSLHMFVEETRSPDLRRLRFLRWLAEHDHFDRPAVGPASGDFADLTGDEVRPASDPPP